MRRREEEGRSLGEYFVKGLVQRVSGNVDLDLAWDFTFLRCSRLWRFSCLPPVDQSSEARCATPLILYMDSYH